MTTADSSDRNLINELRERAKELQCVYEIENVLAQEGRPREQVLRQVVKLLPRGMQYPDVCAAAIQLEDTGYQTPNYRASRWRIEAPIAMQGERIGQITVCYLEARPQEHEGPFLREEARLLRSIADRLGHYLLYSRVRELWRKMDALSGGAEQAPAPGWQVILQMLRDTDPQLAQRLSRKMLNHLCALGLPEAQELLYRLEPEEGQEARENAPLARLDVSGVDLLGRPFDLAVTHLSDEEILARIQKWLQEDRASFLYNVINNPRASLGDIADAMNRMQHVLSNEIPLSESARKSLRVMLTHRLLTEQIELKQVAREVAWVTDFHQVLRRVVMSGESHGKLGGKASGMLLAHWILSRSENPRLRELEIPTTWYVASDAVMEFITYNQLEDVWEQKFKDLVDIRREYPNIVQLFKNSTFPPDFVKELGLALDELGPVPLVVRSSSLLEDRLGTAFSGKYKSLFLANQGYKDDRLAALLDAIAEIYASLLAPDPIEYRRERGLLEFDEQMGILIQTVVGQRVGRYWLPAFAGVAFSRNEFRWSPRIEREDGLVRLVPGLGTRAVDRVGDDFPTLLVPGKPSLHVNVVTDEKVRYSAHKVDALNLATNRFETLDIQQLLREAEGDYPLLEQVFSVREGQMLRRPVPLLFDPSEHEVVTTFEGLVTDTPFLAQMQDLLTTLEQAMNTPVDVEFAHDGRKLYLLQCRPQSQARDVAPAPIPAEIPAADVVFDSRRHVSNGRVPDLTHLVYVDPAAYAALPDEASLRRVGRAVGRLNEALPKRQFALLGPGRWGSRGDLKLGVNVTYADIRNTSLLVEIAWGQGKVAPDLSFGTHFFQDLVEARIRYLPLYPDDGETVFRASLLREAPNLLGELAPDFAELDACLRVIDLTELSGGRVLRVLLNAGLPRAVAYFAEPDLAAAAIVAQPEAEEPGTSERHWGWRLRMAERIASELDAEELGVAGLYVFGSAKNASAGPDSDIDLLVHFRGGDRQRAELLAWLDGWSRCLAEMNHLQTGVRREGLLDVHLVGDEEVARRSGWAAKIGAATDPARELPLRRRG